jgi:hypothetical protein
MKGKQKNFRLSAREAQRVQRAARQAGVTESEWLRLVVLTALGETALLEQLSRVALRARKRSDPSLRATPPRNRGAARATK